MLAVCAFFVFRLPINQTRVHLETSPLSTVRIGGYQRVSAKVRIPHVSSRTYNELEVFTYPAWWLALHALSRMMDAEEKLEALRTTMRTAGGLNQD